MQNDEQRVEIDRRKFLARSALLGATALGTSIVGLPPVQAGTTSIPWGSIAQASGGQSMQQATIALEQKVGRSFSTIHQRMPWTTPLVNNYSSWGVQTGHTPILSWFARRPVRWSRIAAGGYDAWITQQARNLRTAGWSGYFCFHKEPEDEGNATDWKAAYARVRQIFSNVGVTNFQWVVCLIASTYRSGSAGPWIPNAPYDLLGADACNRYRCVGRPWKTFGDLFGAAHDFAVSKNKGLYIIEWGSVEGAAGQKATWVDDARDTIKSWPEVVGVSYLHENSDCNYKIDTSATALARFRAMGADPYFQG